MDDTVERNRKRLIYILRMAYSGEKSAALVYQGHWESVRNPDERAMIQKIEQEEWHHRSIVGEMLVDLGEKPSGFREVMQVMIGWTLKRLCPLCGWFLPMLGAWLLEENNIQEYAHAATYAESIGLLTMATKLREMSEVERQHAVYFKTLVYRGKLKEGN